MKKPITASERLLRHRAVENVLTDLRLEGFTPTAEIKLLLENYAWGETTYEDLLSAVKDKKYIWRYMQKRFTVIP